MANLGAFTTINDATDYLVGVATTALDGICTVYDGAPHKYGEPDYLVLNGFEVDGREPATFGGPRSFSIEEDYSLLAEIAANRGSGVASEARSGAFAIWKAFEAALRQDPTLGGNVIACWISQASSRTEGTANGIATQITLEIRCKARVS